MFLAVVFKAGLVAADLFLMRDGLFEFVVRISKRVGNHAGAELAEIATRNRHAEQIFHPCRDRRVAAMRDRLHPSEVRQHSRPEDRAFRFRHTCGVNNGVKVQRGAEGKCSARGVDLFSITSGETLGKWMLPPHGEGRLWRLI